MSQVPIIGVCIYCGSTTAQLKREHIVPEGFGNKNGDVLGEASCGSCETITSDFERYILRELFGDARKVFGIKSKKKKKNQPTIIKQLIRDAAGVEREIEVPNDEIITRVMLPVFVPPAVTYGDTGTIDCSLNVDNEMFHTNIGKRVPGGVYDQEDVSEILATARFRDKTFEKFLMKIAYCSAVKTYGYEAVKHSPIPFSIRGMDKRFGAWLGCLPRTYLPPAQNNSWLQYGSYDSEFGIVSAVKLFAASAESPEYHILINTN